jgi:hypothetical protein
MFKPLAAVLLIALAGVASATPILNVDLNLCNPYLCAIDGIDIGTVVAKVSATDTASGMDITVTTQDPDWLLWDGKLFAFNAPEGGTLTLPAAKASLTATLPIPRTSARARSSRPATVFGS